MALNRPNIQAVSDRDVNKTLTETRPRLLASSTRWDRDWNFPRFPRDETETFQKYASRPILHPWSLILSPPGSSKNVHQFSVPQSPTSLVSLLVLVSSILFSVMLIIISTSRELNCGQRPTVQLPSNLQPLSHIQNHRKYCQISSYLNPHQPAYIKYHSFERSSPLNPLPSH